MEKKIIVRTAFATYNLQRRIGEGGSGVVHQALYDENIPVAIKMLDPQKATNEKLKRFKNEYKFCARCTHPNIINVIDYGLSDKSEPFFVMPLYEYSLRHLIGNISPKDAINLFNKLLNGIEAAHQLGVVHRDIKPENILVKDKNQNLVIADFGIARFEEEELYTFVETKAHSRLANFQYAAPEQRSKGKTIDTRTDIFSLGLILNELFTSEVVQGTNFKTIRSVAEEYSYLDPVVDKMLQQEAKNRYQSIDEIKLDLIARGAEFISRQKINQLRDTVIPATDVDDPIVNVPMKIVSVDWDENVLRIILNHKINKNWVRALNSMDSYKHILGKEPRAFSFNDREASIHARSDQVQMIIDYFKVWITKTNKIYEQQLRQENELNEQRAHQALKQKIQNEEERLNVLKNLKI